MSKKQFVNPGEELAAAFHVRRARLEQAPDGSLVFKLLEKAREEQLRARRERRRALWGLFLRTTAAILISLFFTSLYCISTWYALEALDRQSQQVGEEP